jgi:hypothetical protein
MYYLVVERMPYSLDQKSLKVWTEKETNEYLIPHIKALIEVFILKKYF